MQPISESLDLIERHIARAVAAANDDPGCSPVLRAILEEFHRKSQKTRAALAGGSTMREPIVELEQAGDSARAGARADPGASAATKDLVELAHTSICLLKAQG